MAASGSASTSCVDDPPTAGRVGDVDDWVLPLDDFEDGDVLRFRARFLGLGSSRRRRHREHEGKYARPGVTCGACRWFEPRLFRETEGPERYLLFLLGGTVVPGEEPRYQHRWLLSGAEVIAALVTHRGDGVLTFPARRLLAEAVGHDVELRDAYRDWEAA